MPCHVSACCALAPVQTYGKPLNRELSAYTTTVYNYVCTYVFVAGVRLNSSRLVHSETVVGSGSAIQRYNGPAGNG